MKKRKEIHELARIIYLNSKQIFTYSEDMLNESQQIVLNYIEENGFWESLYRIAGNHTDISEEVQDRLGDLEDPEFVEVLFYYCERKQVKND